MNHIALILGLGAVTLSAAAVSFILDELSDQEKEKRQHIFTEFDDYQRQREKDLENIEEKFNLQKEKLYNSTDKAINAFLKKYEEFASSESVNLALKIENYVNDQVQSKEEIISEINKALASLKVQIGGQVTNLRQEALETLRRELYESLNKAHGYINYLKSYKSGLYPYKVGQKKIDNDFKMFSFNLPTNYPYKGKLLSFTKEYLCEEEWQEQIDNIVNFTYIVDDLSVISKLENDAEVPVLVSNVEFNSKSYKMKYYLSVGKGYLKDIVLNQSRIGIEAKVKEYRQIYLRKSDVTKTVIVMEYKGIEIYLNKYDLINPLRTPPCGAVLRVYPKKWTCDLRLTMEVSERYEDSLKSFQFSTLPIVFTDEKGEYFIEYIKEHNVDVSESEWKIGPLYKVGVQNINMFKLQLGNSIAFSVSVENESKPIFKFEDILQMDNFFKPDDIFVVMDASLTAAYEDDIYKFEEENYQNMKNLFIMLLQQFKVQKTIKASNEGMIYFNKWSEVNDKLIHYLEKGKSQKVEVNGFTYKYYDRKNSIYKYEAEIINSEEVRNFLKDIHEGYNYDFYIEDHAGGDVPVQFNTTGEKISIYTRDENFLVDTEVTVFNKIFPYPEVQQNRALYKFRCGDIVNSNFKSYILNASNIEGNKKYKNDIEFYNKKLIENRAQKESVVKALSESELFMIQGPPGTGKTTVIREIIRQFVKENINSRILIVSQANVAIDNVLKDLPTELLKDTIRCGNEDKIDDELKKISFENKYNAYIKKINDKLDENNEALYMWKEIINKSKGKYNSMVGQLLLRDHNIIGATCVGLAQKQIGLDMLDFDLVIIDEAGKALPAEMLIPLNKARKCIMIGDHKQLPPTINPVLLDEEKIELEDRQYCRDELFERSLFQNLYEKCPDSNKSMLNTQYRMPAVIGTMVSNCFYEGRIKNGQNTKYKLPIFFKCNLNILDMSYEKSYREVKEENSSIVNKKG